MTFRIRLAAVSALLLAAGPLRAWESADWGPYIGADLGRTSFRVREAQPDDGPGILSGTSRRDKSDATYLLATGFRFSPHLAIEASYLDLGRASYLIEDQGSTVHLRVGSQGPALSLLGTLPINGTWSLEGRAGAYFGKSTLRGWLQVEVDSEGVESLWGAGGADAGLLLGGAVIASLADHWAMRLGYDYLNDRTATIQDPDLSARVKSSAGRVTLGLRYLF